MSNTLERQMDEIEARLERAQREKRAVEHEIREAEREAVAAVRAKFKEQLDAALRELSQAERAQRDAIDATAAHPWDGKRVYRMVDQYRGWSPKPTSTKREDGIVEVVRQSSEFPANIRWSRPSLGHVIVRKLKKDGSPSTQFHKTHGSIEEKWKLAE